MQAVALVFLFASSVLAQEEPPCPTWQTYSYKLHKCVCRDNLSGAIICDESGDVYLRLDFCMTLDTHNNMTVAGICHRGSYKNNQTFRGVFRLLPNSSDQLAEVQCEPNNREGLLCAKCTHGYGVPITSLTPKCMECTAYPIFLAALLYLLIELLPITVFFLLIVIFRVSIFSGPLIGYFIFCQAYTTISNDLFELYTYLLDSSSQPIRHLLNVSYVLSSIWALGALNILPPVCISPKMTFLDAITLKYVRVLYPLFLVPFTFFLIKLHGRNVRLIVCLWRPFGACLRKLNQNIDTNDSIIHAYATLFSLSFGILNYLTYKLMDLATLAYEQRAPLKRRLLSDPLIRAYSNGHAPYLAVAYAMFIFFGVVPSVLALLYPFGRFRNTLERCLSYRKRIMLGIFFDTLHGNFKNGLNGTRDYRVLLGAVMMLTGVVVLFNSHNTSRYNLSLYLALGSILMLVSLGIAYIQPFKTYLANLSMSFHTAISSTMCILLVAWMQPLQIADNETATWMFATLAFLPHLMVFMWLLYRLQQTRRMRALLARIQCPCKTLRRYRSQNCSLIIQH